MLAIGSNSTLNEVLRGEPPPQWTRRPNAKDNLRAAARQLRDQGLAYKEIAARLGVSKSSISLWVRDMPRPERLSYEACRQRQAAAVAAYWLGERSRRAAAKEAVRAREEQVIGALSQREILIAGAMAYLCEGTKSKPYCRCRRWRVVFINSDPRLIGFYLRFLRAAGVQQDQLCFRLHIHESADVQAARDFWLRVTNADPAQFGRTNLKRHNPKTTRLNTGASYYGCLRIDVLRSRELYQRIEGWCDAILASADRPAQAACEDQLQQPGLTYSR